MKKVTLISCVKKKLDLKSKAQDLYQSPLFKKNLAYAKQINSDEIYILSAKYGLLKLKALCPLKVGTLKKSANII